MDNNELKDMIEKARIARGLSQRELSKQIGLSQSTYNDTINGKIKKVDVEILKKIAEGLDLSLEQLLKVSGYNDVLGYFGVDKYKNKSTKDLKEMIEKHKQSELDLLDFDAQKRKKARKARQKLFYTMEHLEIMQKNKESLYTVDKAIEDIKVALMNWKQLKKNTTIINCQKIFN